MRWWTAAWILDVFIPQTDAFRTNSEDSCGRDGLCASSYFDADCRDTHSDGYDHLPKKGFRRHLIIQHVYRGDDNNRLIEPLKLDGRLIQNIRVAHIVGFGVSRRI